MADKSKKVKRDPVVNNDQSNECPVKDGDNCLVPGVYSDSEPIGGG